MCPSGQVRQVSVPSSFQSLPAVITVKIVLVPLAVIVLPLESWESEFNFNIILFFLDLQEKNRI